MVSYDASCNKDEEAIIMYCEVIRTGFFVDLLKKKTNNTKKAPNLHLSNAGIWIILICKKKKKNPFQMIQQDLFWLILLALANELFLVSSLVQLSHTVMKVPYFKQR